jgi:hypothetical protein
MDLKEKAKQMGIRVTKVVNGKRVKLTNKELKMKLMNSLTLNNQAKHAKKFIRVCRTVLAETQPKAPKVPKAPPVPKAPKAPKAPSPPKAPKNARAALMANLKANLKRRGLANN